MPVHSNGYPAFVVDMEGSECASAEDTDAEQLAAAHCTAGQQTGGGWVFTVAMAARTAADSLQKKHHRAENSSQEHTVQLQSLRSYQAHFDHQTFVTFHIIAYPFLQIVETLTFPCFWRNF